jgi:hypothetical protein
MRMVGLENSWIGAVVVLLHDIVQTTQTQT